MSAFHKPIAVFWMFLVLMLVPALACHAPLPEDASVADRQTATAAIKPTAEAIATYEADIEAETRDLMENPDEKIIFSYSGENQSYHTGLRNKTIFYIKYDTNDIYAFEEVSFKEPSGILTRRGTDTIECDSGGVGPDADGVMGLECQLFIHSQGTATGEDDFNTNTVTYNMEGWLSATLVDGQWVGTVKGKATLKQVWPNNSNMDETTSYAIDWTIVGTPVK